jgi:hypothetical protein
MKEKLKKQHAALREKMEKYDQALLKMVNVDTIDIIIKVLTDYLSQPE